MNISILGFVFGLFLLLIPVYAIFHFRLRLIDRFLKAFVCMAVAAGLMAVVVYGAISLKSIVYDIALLVLLPLLAALLALAKSRLKVSRLLVPVGVGSVAAVAIVVFYLLFLVLGETKPFVPHLFVPLAAIVSGGMVSVNAKALQTYYSGLLHHDQLYQYLVGNGATHSEAVGHFVRRSFEAAIVASARKMSYAAFVSAPVLLLVMVMGGTGLFTAVAFQILFYIAVLAASLISLFITLLIGRRYSFDEYNRLKPVFKKQAS